MKDNRKLTWIKTRHRIEMTPYTDMLTGLTLNHPTETYTLLGVHKPKVFREKKWRRRAAS